jgi:hypothetical protein
LNWVSVNVSSILVSARNNISTIFDVNSSSIRQNVYHRLLMFRYAHINWRGCFCRRFFSSSKTSSILSSLPCVSGVFTPDVDELSQSDRCHFRLLTFQKMSL